MPTTPSASLDTSLKPLLWLVAMGLFMQTLDSTIVNTALPAMARSLSESPLKMQSVIIAYTLTTAMLMTAAMTASALTTSTFTFTDQDLHGMLAHSQPPQPIQPAKATESASHDRLRVGLSDPGTQLVLPWFLADLVDAVNRRASPQDFAKKLRDGI